MKDNKEVVQVGNVEIVRIEYKGQPVLTTKQLAECYETTTEAISGNYSNNKDRFVEGKHYFKLEGEELAAFKNESKNFQVVTERQNVLYLWTKRGVVRHCKSTRTDKAWDAFEILEDAYFEPRAVLLDKDEILRSLKRALDSKAQIEARVKTDQKFLQDFDKVLGIKSKSIQASEEVTAEDIRNRLLSFGKQFTVTQVVNIGRKLGYTFSGGKTTARKDLVLKNAKKNLETLLEDLKNYQVD